MVSSLVFNSLYAYNWGCFSRTDNVCQSWVEIECCSVTRQTEVIHYTTLNTAVQHSTNSVHKTEQLE